MADDGKIVDFPEEPWKRPGFVLSDKNLAKCFDVKRGNDFRYTVAHRGWRMFDGVRWIDAGLKIEHSIADLLANEIEPVAAKKPKDRYRIGATTTLTAVERRLRCSREMDETAFDADPWLLNCPSGTMDLRRIDEGMKKHERGDYITKVCAADPFGGCPQWMEFLSFVTREDDQLADYLQRLAGYALAGVADEQIFAFLHGQGGNGKSVFLQTLLYVLGDYGVSCPSHVWTVQPFEQHPEQIMRLRGARLIVSTEIPKDAVWNVERINAVTGGERIVARGMRQESVEFNFCGTLLIAGNDKPEIANVNDATRRRIHLVPFGAKVNEDDVDKGLKDKLKAEAGGILQWMIEGCAAWQLEGLRRASVVLTATTEYFADEDHLRGWLEECCDVHPQATTREKTGDLFGSWKRWCDGSGLKAGSINQFSARLAASGIKRVRNDEWRGFIGIALRPPPKKNNSNGSRQED